MDSKTIEMTPFGPLVKTLDGSFTIRHSGHGQDFHSSEGARYEAYSLYVAASGFQNELVSGSSDQLWVLDVGMGLAYNACASINAWLESPGSRALTIVSLEIDGDLVAAVASGVAPWFRGWNESWLMGPRALQKMGSHQYTAKLFHPLSSSELNWIVVVGDGSKIRLEDIVPSVNFVWQDPFTPELNPSMWSGEWFARLRNVSQPTTTIVTYSVARVVRDALIEGGWHPDRIKTPGKKRHWLKARPVN